MNTDSRIKTILNSMIKAIDDGDDFTYFLLYDKLNELTLKFTNEVLNQVNKE